MCRGFISISQAIRTSVSEGRGKVKVASRRRDSDDLQLLHFQTNFQLSLDSLKPYRPYLP